MKERPIPMATESVKAILEGSKTQTRRIIKPQPEIVGDHVITCLHWKGSNCGSIQGNGQDWLKTQCPYGQAGDTLWVREKFAIRNDGQQVMHYAGYLNIIKALELPEFDIPWKPSIFMPRWASRITLEITEVRVERLQEITHIDARREGIPNSAYAINGVTSFKKLWDPLNAKRGYGWGSNPWVWALSFRRIECQT